MTPKARSLALSVCVTIVIAALAFYGTTRAEPSVSLHFAGSTTNRSGKSALLVLTNQGWRTITAFEGDSPSSPEWERVVPPPPPFREPEPSELRPNCRVVHITLTSSQGVAFAVPVAGLDCLQIETTYMIAEPTNLIWQLMPAKMRWHFNFQRELKKVRSPLISLDSSPR